MGMDIRGLLKGKNITRADAALITVVALLLGFSFYLDYISGNAGTKDWLLLAARKWLNGEVLYVDIFEVNPPLIVWIYALPVYMSMHTGLIDFHALVLLGLCMATLSLGLCMLLIRLYPPLANDKRKQLHFSLLLALVLVAFINPIYFADREHIFFMLTLPYMLRNMPGMASAAVPLPLRIVIGLLAGIGFCIKPYCIIIFTGIQLLVLLQRRANILSSTENILIYTCGMLYLFLVLHFTPHYLHDVLPIALATYSAYKGSQNVFVLFGVFFTFAMTFVEFRPGHVSVYRRDIGYFLGLCALCLVYALANNGWTYTYLPLQSIIMVATGLVFWEFKALAREARECGKSERSFRFGALACMLNLIANSAMVALVFFAALMTGYNNDAFNRDNGLKEVIMETQAKTFGTLTIDFLPWAHLVRATGADWDTRFNHLWMLPKFIVSDVAFAHSYGWILKTVADDLADDMDANKPDLMFVNVHPVVCPACKPAEILPFFLPYPAFAKAWMHYHYLRKVDICPSLPKEFLAKNAGTSQSAKKACQYDVYQRSR